MVPLRHLFSFAKPARTARGYSITVYRDMGPAVFSSLPAPSRNDAVTRAWTLANDMRAGRVS
jgi:hypothetical protein